MADLKIMGTVLFAIILSLTTLNPAEGQVRGSLASKVIYAVNAGGPPHIDAYGVRYEEDRNEDGIPSDYGKRLEILRVADLEDHILYQTERYGTRSFSYDIPIKDDGNYVLVLKFCEVYFRSPDQKIFNVILNNQHLAIPDLDIFREAGIATAHDEYVEFKVKNKGKTFVIGETESTIVKGRVPVTFAKGPADNPKINAFYVIKGSINDVPKLPPMRMPEEEFDELPFEEEEDDEEISLPNYGGDNLNVFSYGNKKRIRSGPVAFDPWELESTNLKYLPVYGALAASSVSFLLIFSVLKI